MTVLDAIKRASAQQYGGEAQTDEIEDEQTLDLYMQYAREGFEKVWQRMEPLDRTAFPAVVRIECPEIAPETDMDPYGTHAYSALADYITWRMFATGSMSRQQRGQWYYQAYMNELGLIDKDGSWAELRALTGAGASDFRDLWRW